MVNVLRVFGVIEEGFDNEVIEVKIWFNCDDIFGWQSFFYFEVVEYGVFVGIVGIVVSIVCVYVEIVFQFMGEEGDICMVFQDGFFVIF